MPQLNLGDKKIDFPFILAPMASITNAPFRLLMKELGAGVVISELVSASGLQYEGRKTLDLCRYFEGERPVGLQIFGEDGHIMGKAALQLQTQGVDFIDINLGCPVPKVVKKGGGSAMCRDPRNLFEVLKTIKEYIKIPLTIKIRTGWDDSSKNALECIMAAYEAGVTWVAIHGRTRAQGYEGLSDWDFISAVKKRSPIPIIGNGDILTAKQALQRLQDSGCDGVMIGRGALRNPFLFLEILQEQGKPLSSIQTEYRRSDGFWDYWKIIDRHYDLMKSVYNEFQTGVQLRKFMTWYCAGFEGASQFRKGLYSLPVNGSSSIDEVLNLGREFFDRPGLKKQQSYLNEAFLQGGHG